MGEHHCETCTCGRRPLVRQETEYGVTFVGGVKDGQTYGPLGIENIGYWNRHWGQTARLVIRTKPVATAKPTKWRRATDAEVDVWNRAMARSTVTS